MELRALPTLHPKSTPKNKTLNLRHYTLFWKKKTKNQQRINNRLDYN